MRTYELRAAAGITLRQVDYWTRVGYLRADNPGCGSGGQISYAPEEALVATLMRRLLDAGLRLGPAHDAARKLMEGVTWGFQPHGGRLRVVELGPGLRLEVTTEDTRPQLSEAEVSGNAS